MKINENVCYASPEVEVVKVAVECGFAGSTLNPDSGLTPDQNDGDL